MNTRTTFFSALLLLVGFNMAAQQITWQKAIGGTQGDAGATMAATADGGFIISGTPMSGDGDIATPTLGYGDAWLAKLDAAGEIQWQKRYGGSDFDEVKSVTQTSDGGYIFCGSVNSTDGDLTGLNPVNYDAWIVKLDAVGTIEWQKIFGGTLSDYGNKIIQTADGGYLCAGYKAVAGNNTDGWAIKLSASGDLQWEKFYAKANRDYLYDVKPTTDGGYIFCGSTNPLASAGGHGPGDNEGWAIKTDGQGVTQWMKNFGGYFKDEFIGVELTDDGSYLFAGSTQSNDGNVYYNHDEGYEDFWVVVLDSAGALQWEKTYGTGRANICYSMRKTDNGYLLAGTTTTGIPTGGDLPQGSYNYTYDAWAIEIDPFGGLLWQKNYGGNQGGVTGGPTGEWFRGAVRLADGSSAFFGTTASTGVDVTNFHGGSSDMWLVKVAPNNYDYISINGSATANPPLDYPMATLDGINYRAHRILLSGQAGLSVRFRKDQAWTVNWGGPSTTQANNFPSATGIQDGQNIVIPTTAFYDVTLNIQTGAYTFTNVGTPPAISIFGSNTGGADIAMQRNSDYMVYTLSHTFASFGSVRFRKNGNNDINWALDSFPTGYGVQNGALIPVPPGSYNITFNMLTGYYTFTVVLSTEDFGKDALRIYPNPAMGQIQVKSPEAVGEMVVYDLSGRVAAQVTNSDSMDLSGLQSGIYILKVTTGEGSFTKQVIKQIIKQ